MKECPICKTQYSDDTFSFCLQDGAALVDVFQDDIPTVARRDTPIPAYESIPTTMPVQTPVPSTIAVKAHRPSIVLAVFATMIVMLFGFGIVGFLGYVLLKPGDEKADNLANVPVTPSPTKSKTPNFWIPPSPQPSKKPSMIPAVNSNLAPPIASNDRETKTRQIAGLIGTWRTRAEMRDLNSYMALYAPTVDYYRRGGASRASIRADRQRAFSIYSSLRITISNLNIKLDAFGTEATATFDKEWDFRGGKASSGKVQQMLRFRLIDGQWLITAEKDLKVYNKT